MVTSAPSFESRSREAAVDAASSRAAASAVAWPAIIAGAFVAAGVSVILVALGSGLGLASISPWADRGLSATTFTVSAAIWLLVTQWISAGIGGYIAGRLRTRWIGTHVHEVFFRDTAHGLITWAVAALLIALFAAATAATVVGGSGGRGEDESRGVAARIVANAVATGHISDADRSYLAELAGRRAGVTGPEAQGGTGDLVAGLAAGGESAKQAEDRVRKAASEASLYLALSLLIGAFVASVAAALGGRERDHHA